MTDRLCYTCSTVRLDADIAACPREYCAARRDLEREQAPKGVRSPQRNPGELAPYYDDGGER